MSSRAGVSLLELLLVLTLVGLLGGIVVPALGPPPETRPLSPDDTLLRVRAHAIRAESSVVTRTEDGSQTRFLPDGRAIGTAADATTGMPTVRKESTRERR